MTLPAAYATSVELVAYWRPLSDAEKARADVLLGAAADLINEQPGAATFVVSACKWVSLDMVKRAMIGGAGVTSSAQSMADMSATTQYANPMGNLYLTRQELGRLAGFVSGSAFSLALTSNARVTGYPWTWQPSTQTDVSP